jgi:cobalt/nickel transport system permease protein
MHLPDGFLDTRTALLATAMAAGGVGLAVRHVRASIEPRRMPLLGLAAAFIFAAQMLNFPIAGGTSGHLVGGVLSAVMLGPGAAIVVVTCVLIVQCLMFADGGLLALGANVFNMAIVSVCSGYGAFRLARVLFGNNGQSATIFAAGFGAWVGTVVGSISCAGQLALSQTVPWSLGFPAMTNIHILIGLAEGVATSLVVAAVLRTRPTLVADEPDAVLKPKRTIAYGLIVCAGLGLFVAPFACPWPDGLDRVAQSLGFNHKAVQTPIASPLADYRLPGIGSPTVATGVAAAAGTLVVFTATYLLAKGLVPLAGNRKKDAPSN